MDNQFTIDRKDINNPVAESFFNRILLKTGIRKEFFTLLLNHQNVSEISLANFGEENIELTFHSNNKLFYITLNKNIFKHIQPEEIVSQVSAWIEQMKIPEILKPVYLSVGKI
jgi:hypothetical protein